jgi:hypothetical protein
MKYISSLISKKEKRLIYCIQDKSLQIQKHHLNIIKVTSSSLFNCQNVSDFHYMCQTIINYYDDWLTI